MVPYLSIVLLRINGYVLVILSRIKIDMPDLIDCDIAMRTCRLELTDKGFFSVNKIVKPIINYDRLRNLNYLK